MSKVALSPAPRRFLEAFYLLHQNGVTRTAVWSTNELPARKTFVDGLTELQNLGLASVDELGRWHLTDEGRAIVEREEPWELLTPITARRYSRD